MSIRRPRSAGNARRCRLTSRFATGLALALALFLAAHPASAQSQQPLTTVDYRVVGVALRPARESLAIPKNVPGAITIELIAGGADGAAAADLARGAIVEATLRGPSFAARRLVALPNGDLLLPPLPLVGDYSLDDIRLVDTASGQTKLDAKPRSVPITVFDEVLVSRVTSRPLTIEEIEAKGIVIDESNFRILEFEVGFVLDGETIPVRFPVVAPRFDGNVELIPKAELEALLAEADLLNAELGLGADIPDALEASGLDIDIRGVNFQFVDPAEAGDLALGVPPIPGLLVVPGRIGLLNQFFSVMLFTENAAPNGSGLSVRELSATMTLPRGADQLAGTQAAPGDDPLRFARIGPDAVVEPTQPIVGPGGDGQLGTADDRIRLQPGETGQAEFLVEGLKEGLHVMDVTLDGLLDGLGQSSRRIRGFASGSVLVRNPKFSLAFTHPRTIRAGEPYTASVTLLNTSLTPANLVSVTLPAASLSGAIFEPGTPEVAELGTIRPGETKTADFRLRAQRTGAITFSQLTSDGDIVGRFRLRMGVDERGVPLSPDSLGYPEFADDLRELAPLLFQSIERYLGQALSVATAAQLPPGVLKTSRGSLNQRVVEIAEAGQRLRYGDAPVRVLTDLLLDFAGARTGSPGLDQIWRETDAGRELREAFLAAIAASVAEPNAVELLAARAIDLAGRGEAWRLAAVGDDAWSPRFELLGNSAELGDSAIGGAAGFSGAPSDAIDGHWLASKPLPSAVRLVAGTDTLATEVALLDLPGNGSGALLRWSVPSLPAGACLRADLANPTPALEVDETCNGTVETSLLPAVQPIVEPAPSVLAVVQDEHVLAGRPSKHCPRGDIDNYGTVVAVLFSKPMTQASVGLPAAYQLEDGNAARSVQIQPGGRVALLNMAQPLGALVPRTLSVAPDVTDPRGNPLLASAVPVLATAAIGVSVSGRVIRGNGEPAVGVPVTLTMYDEVSAFVCELFVTRPAQARTDAAGRFHFDYVPAGIPYSVSATDTTGLGNDAEALILAASSDELLDRSKLLELASGAEGTLLESFLVGALPEAIAAAEGLDRALLRDSVDVGSQRVGANVPVTLRFRGRGTVFGTVLESDGVTPSPGAAANLFPDPDSRELGRGVLADAEGRFAFFGVPLGNFSIEATSVTGRTRSVAGVLSEPGSVADVAVVLSATAVARGAIEGRVLEPGSGEGHAGARVFVGKFTDKGFENVVAVATAAADGSYRAENVPVGTWDLVAVSFDGRRQGERLNVGATANGVGFANVTLQGRTAVRGRVEFANGAPGGFALVAGGEGIVRADADGNFELSGVPTGRRSIEAAVEVDAARGIEFTRLGSASLDVIAGVENFVVVRLQPAGRIRGIVRDAALRPVPNVDVSIPQGGGFLWVHANAEGRFEFPNLALDSYTVSAPAPPHEDVDVAGILDTLSGSPTSGDLEAAITRAFEIFTGVNNPLLNGEGLIFNPSSWGYEKTALTFDGQTAFVDIVFLPEGTIAGTVRNGQGVPIGARVRLTGVGPTLEGDVGFIVRGERNSDPALGTFAFPGQALAGDFGVQAATPFFPAPISISGQTSRVDPDRNGLLLQFPSENLVNGRLAGRVFAPDGSLVVNAKVKINFGDLEIRTDATGRFDTQLDLPAFDAEGRERGYGVEAEDETTGLRGQSFVTLRPGITNLVDVRLLAKDGALRVRVLDGVGAPVANAAVEVRQGSFPLESFQGTTGASGEVVLSNLFEGGYGVDASAVLGTTTQRGATAIAVRSGSEALAVVRLGATATLRGTFVAIDRVTPIAFAQLRIAGIGFATSDASGVFEMTGLPLGTHQLIGQDAQTGRLGTLNVSLGTPGEIRNVLLVERALGLVEGSVIDGFGTGTVAGVQVTLRTGDGFSPSRTVTTDPAGRFAFPGVPAGGFDLRAVDARTDQIGGTSATLAAGTLRLEVDVRFAALTQASVVVLEPNGVAPADATVTLRGPFDFLQSLDTDAAGRAVFGSVPLGEFTVSARSRLAGTTRSTAQQTLAIDVRPVQPEVTLTLSGAGRVEGHLFASDGTTPVASRAVELAMLDAGAAPIATQTTLDGSFAFDDVALGDFRLVGRDAALAATENGTLSAAGDVVTVDLELGSSGNIVGRLVSQDGTLAVGSAEIGIAYTAPSGALGRDVFRTAADGVFHFEAIPLGAFEIETFVPIRNGIARVADAIAADGETVDLGDVRLDEEDPRVVASAPVAGDQQVAIETPIRLTMNEPLDAATLDPRAIFVRSLAGQGVAADVALVVDPVAGDARVLEIRPDAPLASETEYQVVVVDGELLSAVGAVIAEGPRDLVGRALAAPFTMTFRTRDQDPPGLLSISPPNGTIQVDPRAVLRLSFDEPIAASGIAVTLTGPNGAVAGRTDIGVGARVVVFTPNAVLQPNATYSAQIAGVRDLAGNLAEGLPFASSFATLDTLGPVIAQLTLGGTPVGGATVTVNAALAQLEAGASVRMSADLVPFGASAPGVLSLPFVLPLAGAPIVRAIAIDRFGNEGPIAELPIAIGANQPPTVAIQRLVPSNGPIASGSTATLRISAADDVRVGTLKAAAEGAGSAPLTTTTGAAITLAIAIPANTGPGQSVTVHAEAIDSTQQSSGEQTLSVAVSDGTAPTASFAAPAAGTTVIPSAPLTISVQGSDNFGVTRFEVSAEGAFTATQSLNVAGSPGTIPADFSLDVPADLGGGGEVTLRVRAFDAAGLVGEATRVLIAPDGRGPRLALLLPPDASSQSTSPVIAAHFDEAIVRASVTAARFQLLDAANAAVATQIGFAEGDRVVTLTPQAALASGASFRVVLQGGITDVAGNAIANGDGTPLVRVEHAFTIGGAVLEAPASGGRVIEGQSLVARAVADAGIGERAVSFLASGVIAATLPADLTPQQPHVYETNLSVPTIATLGGSELRVSAALVLPGNLATQAGVVATASSNFDARFPASRAADGNLDTSWFSRRPAQPGEFVDVTLAQPATVGRVEVFGNRESPDGFDIASGTVTLFDAQGGVLFQSGTIVLPAPVRDAAIDVGVVDGVARVRFTALGGDAGEWGLAEIVVRPVLRTNVATLEVFAAGADEDGDGIPNGAEQAFGTDPFVDDRALDDDADGLSNAQEFTRGTGVRNFDSDGDGLSDGAEVAAGLDPLDVDSDDDGQPDGEDILGGPRVLSIEPAAGAISVSVRPRIRVRFDEPLARASITAASFALLENGTTPVAATFVFSEGDRVVDLVPNAPLVFSTGYTLALTSAVAGTDAESIRNTDGSDVTAPIERGFTTGVFGLTDPAGGVSVREQTTLALAASGNASLGIASVRFEVNGAVVSTDSAAPFAASFAVPAANVAPTLSITAIAFDAGNVELARDTVSVSVAVGLDVASRVLGVPLGGTRDLVLRLPVARATALDVTIVSLDAAVASVPASLQTIPAGATELRVPVTGVAEGATTLVASTIEDQVVVAASVSALAGGATLDLVAAPVGAVIVPFPSAGDVIVPASSSRTVTLRILTAPAAADTVLVITSSDPAIASIAGPVVIPAGSTEATFEITTGAAGTAILTLVVGNDGRELRVISGAPSAANTPPVVAPPIGIVIVPFSSAGDVIVPASSTRSVTLRILTAPAATDIELGITSSDPAVASIAGPVVIPAGSTEATFEITTGAAGTAILTLVVGNDGRELRVLAGAPSAANAPPVVAPPIGIVIVPFSSAGDVIVPVSSTRSVSLRILTAPAATDIELGITSSDPAIASIAGPVVIPAGSTEATFAITTGAAGTAILTLVAGNDGRELRVISGAPSAANTPPVVAAPIGLVVLEAGNAGTLFLDPGDTKTFDLTLLAFPSLVDLPVTAESLDASVATVSPGAQLIPTGESVVTLTVTATAAGNAETRIDLVFGVELRTLRVVVGVPTAANAPPTIAPPVGIRVEPLAGPDDPI